jgi:hypothetical protein
MFGMNMPGLRELRNIMMMEIVRVILMQVVLIFAPGSEAFKREKEQNKKNGISMHNFLKEVIGVI